MSKEFYGNGKLLLTGEYAILDGAKGLALPTAFGQYLKVRQGTQNHMCWKSIDEHGKVWFDAEINSTNLQLISTSDNEIAEPLLNILKEAQKLNSDFLAQNERNLNIEARITFPRNWGLGTSSTLIANIAAWANINPYKLLEASFGGSGYDIACATHNTAITYIRNGHKPHVQEVDFNPDFADQLFFVYLNQKQNSRDAIKRYRTLTIHKEQLITKINALTDAILNCENLGEFEMLLNKHEALLADTLGLPTIKNSLFPDYTNTIKSLGAWGGDFILATGKKTAMDYFRNKGYYTILPYTKMIL
ncbi:Mevalonate kinase [Maribacter sedimenticola]|uniref:Mevalonate kinase n=1 Tax=Maribacter sedimenticola TaxID=228956 RepID=A0ABY1SI19_9FLAO|nr:GYDIA family GHMP kinase [Maribacter sedimenticola]SNR53809.1 Mevalonate kinase [Maribacter sedimenticola]